MPETAGQPTYLSTLLQLGQTLNSSLELSQVLHIAIDKVVEFMNAERGFILLVEEGTNRVWGKASREIDPQALEGALSGRDPENAPQISHTIVEQAIKSKKPVVSLNAMEDPRFSKHTSVKLAQLRSVLCVPLLAKGRALGIIYVDNRVKSGVFEDRHVEMMQAFTNQASVAIENARLYENLRRHLEDKLKLQEELHEKEMQRLALEEANRLKSDYIGYISHELRNPLTTIRGYVQMLLMDGEELGQEARQEFYETIEAETDRMLDLLNSLLDSSRLEAGRPLNLNLRELEIGPLLARLARSQRFYKFWTPNHKLEVDIAPDLPEIEVDEDKVHQIVANLLSNAIKYSPDGGLVRLSAAPHDGGIRITVSDEGVGLTDEQTKLLFGRYERLERPDIERISGTGLGLYLTRHLVELHGGAISCESTPGRGSTFSVDLPLHRLRLESRPPGESVAAV